MSADGYTIRPALREDLAALPAIERLAATRFRVTAFASMADFALTSTHVDLDRERVWVAVAPDDQLVGFAIAHLLDGCAHLHELDVHPNHGQRGLGRRLIVAVARWARSAGSPALTLSTFRDVPWNAPFYARLGFRPLNEGELSAGLRAIRQAEAAAGLPIEQRVCMRLDLATAGSPQTTA